MHTPFIQYFPFFEHIDHQSESGICYLDSAATSHKHQLVIEAMNDYYLRFNANVHRSAYDIATIATTQYEHARRELAQLINAEVNEIVFTSGATEAANTIANGIHSELINGKDIWICESEHHANLIPWQQLAKIFQLNIRVLTLEHNGQFTSDTLNRWLSCIDENTSIVACAHVSNVLGNIYPIKEISKRAREIGAISIVDGTQAMAHLNVDVKSIDCDFYFFSAHKMYGPNGVGVLYGKYHILERLLPSKLGGEMIQDLSWDHATWQSPPLKFEAGTSNIAGVIGFAKAAQFIRTNIREIQKHETQLYAYLLEKLQQIPTLRLLGELKNSIAVLSFVNLGQHSHDLTRFLDTQGICIRAGHHCAIPLLKRLELDGCLRVSLACYNEKADIDRLVAGIHEFFRFELEAQRATENNELQERVKAIKTASSWNDKHRHLLLLSTQLPVLEISERNSHNELFGCEARVWVSLDNTILAYSDSKIVRGILTLLIEHTNRWREDSNLQSISLEESLKFHLLDMGLTNFFSIGRRDGINKVIQKLNELVIEND